jgi:hypothetical protein
MPQALFRKMDGLIEYYNSGSALLSGAVVVTADGRIGVVNGLRGIAASEYGTLAAAGHFDIAKVTGALSVGDRLYWNPTGDPVGGTAGTGAATGTVANGVTLMGIVENAAASGDATVHVLLKETGKFNGSTRPAVLAVTAAGSVQGDAAQTIEGLNIVTGADGTKGVVLPTAVAGIKVYLKGVTAGVLKIYPATGGTINALSANAAISLASGAVPVILLASSTTQWYTFPLVPS